MQQKKILLIEDEKSIREMLKINLEKELYIVKDFENAQFIYEHIELAKEFDLLVLDSMMPKISGIELCHKIRTENLITPILFLTAKNTSKDIVEGLTAGADDYLGKPFDLDEFLLRVRNLLIKGDALKKISNTNTSQVNLGRYTIYLDQYEALDDSGKKITLSKKEVQLIQLLYKHKNQVVSRDRILREISDNDLYASARTIDNLIVNLRKYFEEDSKNPQLFLSIRGVGYKLNL